MKPLNYQIILSNLDDALEELKDLRNSIATNEFSEIEFRMSLQHIYHHLNFAWNLRNESTEKYADLTEADFEVFGKYPEDIDFEK